ncbi:choline/ethanolaminephosphotransferase 1-like isoform X2 [Cucurbita moschata]|uniref:Choline/ethanolaminephosphotransferase 1-like isoform X2 n=1 Tax=Cucurbita moschata TaxID=3662 RepID=A0A6J1G0T1_CUCMO|nr:choline/ethanolaminephosphotransferase 1-like isoform X2 [Cucurbita moschata]
MPFSQDVIHLHFESLAFGVTVACGMNTFFLWVIAAIPSYGATWEQQVVSSQSEYWCSRLSSTTWKILTIFKLGSIASSVLSVVYEVVQVRKGSMLLAFAMLCPFAVLLGGILAWYDLELLKIKQFDSLWLCFLSHMK